MIARLLTQRACLSAALGLIGDVPGPVLEIGLGKGRTFSFLSDRLPGRPIYALDRDVHAPADAQPPAERLFLGEIEETLPDALAQIGTAVAFVHADIGTEKRKGDDALAALIGRTVEPALAPGALVAGDRDLGAETGLEPVALPPVMLPDGIEPWPYFLYRRHG